jgi:hypothetical protein
VYLPAADAAAERPRGVPPGHESGVCRCRFWFLLSAGMVRAVRREASLNQELNLPEIGRSTWGHHLQERAGHHVIRAGGALLVQLSSWPVATVERLCRLEAYKFRAGEREMHPRERRRSFPREIGNPGRFARNSQRGLVSSAGLNVSLRLKIEFSARRGSSENGGSSPARRRRRFEGNEDGVQTSVPNAICRAPAWARRKSESRSIAVARHA